MNKNFLQNYHTFEHLNNICRRSFSISFKGQSTHTDKAHLRKL